MPSMRSTLLPIIKEGKEFGSKEELEEYLRDHPKADKSKHTLSDSAKDGDKEEKPYIPCLLYTSPSPRD